MLLERAYCGSSWKEKYEKSQAQGKLIPEEEVIKIKYWKISA